MQNPKKQNSFNQIQSDFFEITICRDQEKKPFLNVFHFEGNNFDEKKLGKLFAVIQVEDQSENSAYLPNLLSQIIKKNFYRRPKDGFEKSFENALHRLNLALSDLAEHNIIQWLGKTNAVVGVVNNKKLLLSYAGKGLAFLGREKKLLDIIQPSDRKEQKIHPVKTFSELIEGKIEENDKLIITTNRISLFFKKDELKRHFAVFNSDEFDNLLNSSLQLEGDEIGTLIINLRKEKGILSEKEATSQETILEKETSANFFGINDRKNILPLQKDSLSEMKKEIQEDNKERDENKREDILAPLGKNSQLFIKEKEWENESQKNFSSHHSAVPLKEKITSFFSVMKKNYSVIEKKASPLKKNFSQSSQKSKKEIAKIIQKIRNWLNEKSKLLIKKIQSADYSKIGKFINHSFQITQKSFIIIFQYLKKGKNKMKIGLILAKKRYDRYKEKKDRRKRIDRF